MGMDPEIKAQWLAALRSEEYTQGHNQLETVQSDGPSTYCCLGVLCDLAVKAGVTQRGQFEGDVVIYGDSLSKSWSQLPDGVSDWAGLYSSNPSVYSENGNSEMPLDWLNDIEGLDFYQIADAIERSL